MPDYEDLFLIQLLLENNIVTVQELHDPLCLFYRKSVSGKNVHLIDIIEQLGLLNSDELYKLSLKIAKLISSICPTFVLPTQNIILQDCKQEKLLGTNSLGSSYLVHCPQKGSCLYKKLDGIISRNTKFTHHFLSQLKKIENFRHENVADLYKVDVENQIILREFIVGETLESLIHKKSLCWDEASIILWDVVHGLQALYNQGLLHKNLKPCNIILADNNHAKIVDFYLPPTVSTYLAPEQKQKKKSDLRADIYSLGLIYYQCLGGNLSNGFDLTTLKEIPEPIISLLEKMTNEDYEQRYNSYDALIQDITESLKKLDLDIAHIESDTDKQAHIEETVESILQDLLPTWRDKIQAACAKHKFYEELAPMIQTFYQRYYQIMGRVGLEYLDETLENLRKVVTSELAESTDIDEHTPVETGSFDNIPATPIQEVKPKGCIPINENEILEADIPTADLAEVTPESFFQDLSDLDSDMQDTAMDAVSVDDTTLDSFPQEKDFDMIFGKPSGGSYFSSDASATGRYVSSIAQGANNVSITEDAENLESNLNLEPVSVAEESIHKKIDSSEHEEIENKDESKLKPAFPKKQETSSNDIPTVEGTKLKPAFFKKQETSSNPAPAVEGTKLKPAFPKKQTQQHPTYSFKPIFPSIPKETATQNAEKKEQEEQQAKSTEAQWKRPASEIHISEKPLPDPSVMLELAKQDAQDSKKMEEQETKEEQENNAEKVGLTEEEKAAKLKPYFFNSNNK